ncbi:MAG: plasmid maintenance system killer protein [Chloroflexota bacterium]|nr:MAG: plasmid maintenance system killer protein [Chloroflexota bacterium]
MDVRFEDDRFDKLETDLTYTAGFAPAIESAFRKRMQQIRAAVDERDLRNVKSLRFEKLKGTRQHQHSMRLNDQYRLIVELEGRSSCKVVAIIGIEDYH